MISKEQFGFNTFWWEQLHGEKEIESCVTCLTDIGYRYVEFKRDSFVQKDLAAEFKLAAEITRSAGLEVSNFVILRDLAGGDAKGIDDVVETIEATRAAGVSLLNCCFGGMPTPIQPPPEDWWMQARPSHGPAWDRLVPALEKICDAAEKHDVFMVLEATIGAIVHDFYSTQELFRRFDHPRLCLTLDPSHFFLYRNDIPYAIRELGSKIKHVHVKDAIGVPGTNLDQMFPILGSGGIDWVAFFGALEEIGYGQALSGEYEQFKYMAQVLRYDPVAPAQETYQAMRALLDIYRAHVGGGGG